MADREKAIKGLEHCGQPTECDGCPYDSEVGGCFTKLKEDALALLKEQEAVASPIVGDWISVNKRLPKKNQIVIVSDGEHTWDVGMYRSLCGKPYYWNWKKNTVKTVLWWMPKDGALPEPPR